MNGQIDLITLISLIVAAVAIFKLRSVLGQRTDEDENRVERLKAREREAQKGQAANPSTGDVITLPRRPRDDVAPAPAPDTAADTDARIKAYAAIDPTVTDGLLAVAKQDPALDPDVFVKGAGAAYEMIVSAFASGDRKTLKDLLTREVYDGFVTAMGERDQRGEKVDQQFVGIKRADIVEAELKGGTAYITVRFVSE
nr:Tim44/TimA family putative adaptor protein [Hyphomicrobium sp.]